ncbi:hypothetical protein C349_05285 [Cryptococcus neoformans var. grubii Br795]|nr:hypothetical protein C349_05285 [Cryptococcus neoformans var. grubii Br795]OXG80654.1 hypothetical protein C346_05192 [Cryptococcus neoformans var. grubii D17-1]OXG93414.1 hypothetical protein C345_05080 [Cryptococcus neoformans var. grubii A2-102-5]
MVNTRSKSDADTAKLDASSPTPSSTMAGTSASRSPKTPNSVPSTCPLSLYPTPKSLSGSPVPDRSQTEPGPASESAVTPVTGCEAEPESAAVLGSPTEPRPQSKSKPQHKAKAQPKCKTQPPKAESPIKACQPKGKSRPKASFQPKAASQSKATHQCKTAHGNARKCINSLATNGDEDAAIADGYTLLDVLAASRIVNDVRGSDSNLFGLLLLSVVSELQPSWTNGKMTALEAQE